MSINPSSQNLTCYTVIALGSAGDTHPLFTIALALKNQGHDVLFLSSPKMASIAKAANLSFAPICTSEDLERTLSHPRLWEARAGLGVLWRYLGVPALEPTIKALKERLTYHPNAQHVVLASALAMGARIARELHRFHLVTAYTSPANLRQIEGPFFIGDIAVPTWLPKIIKQQLWKVLDRYKLDPMMSKGLEDIRYHYGLPPLGGNYLEKWMHSPDTGIALWPAWFDSIKHPGQYQAPIQTNFIFSGDVAIGNPQTIESLPEPIEVFLNAGPAPLVWMPGSAVRHPQQFFDYAIKASKALGYRALLLTNDKHYQASSCSKEYLVHPLASFTQLLPRCKALIHHGGIGSAAAAIRAGIPQLIIASAFDQFFNGHRIQTLGLGTWCKKNTANLNVIECKLEQSLKLPLDRIQYFQEHLLKKNGVKATYKVLDTLFTT
jgi:rhamnosyltransferase subunit B